MHGNHRYSNLPLLMRPVRGIDGLGRKTNDSHLAPHAENARLKLSVCTFFQGIDGLLHGDCGVAALSIVLV
jgi:hypothetical protein